MLHSRGKEHQMRKSHVLFIGVFAVLAVTVQYGRAEGEKVGQVDKLQGNAEAYQGAQKRNLAAAGDVLFNDKIETGDAARMEATLADDTKVTLGERGRLVIDKFVYNPDKQGGALSMNVKGAFLFVGGKIEGPTGGNVAIHTPVGTLGVRGTTVWGGFIDGGYGVLVLDGEVTVSTKRGMVTLHKGQGTMVYGDKAPNKAAPWPDARVKAAVATISFK
jgi:hypothetical protein